MNTLIMKGTVINLDTITLLTTDTLHFVSGYSMQITKDEYKLLRNAIRCLKPTST